MLYKEFKPVVHVHEHSRRVLEKSITALGEWDVFLQWRRRER